MQVDVDDVLGTHERDLHRNIRRIRLDGETGNVIGKVEFSLPLSAPLCPSPKRLRFVNCAVTRRQSLAAAFS